jgi:hypothetical protein
MATEANEKYNKMMEELYGLEAPPKPRVPNWRPPRHPPSTPKKLANGIASIPGKKGGKRTRKSRKNRSA